MVQPENVGKDRGDELADKLMLTRRRLLPSVNDLKSLGLSLIQIEILIRLIEGRRTAVELASEIYGVRPDDPSFEMYYTRVRRASRELQSRARLNTSVRPTKALQADGTARAGD